MVQILKLFRTIEAIQKDDKREENSTDIKDLKPLNWNYVR